MSENPPGTIPSLPFRPDTAGHSVTAQHHIESEIVAASPARFFQTLRV